MSKLNQLISKAYYMNHRSQPGRLIRLAGGYGAYAAVQDAVSLLKRVVMANLLWEDIAFIDGKATADQIKALVPQCAPQAVYDITLAARTEQKLRHTPLLLAVEMCRYPEHARLVGDLLPKIITRADMLTDFLALYWSQNDGKKSLSHQAAKGLAEAFHNFDEYQFAKYDRDTVVKLRDVMFLCHPTPRNDAERELFRKIAERDLSTPDTWEVALSAGADKKETFERLVSHRKLGGLAFLRNLANMRESGVSREIIEQGFKKLHSSMLLPFDYLKAYQMNPDFKHLIEEAMFASARQQPRLKGRTLFIVDVSGSMWCSLSQKSDFNRLDCAMAMTILATEVCDDFEIVCTAGEGWDLPCHEWIQYPRRGFGLISQIKDCEMRLGGMGIFTRACLDWCYKKFDGQKPFDRIIVFSDSQDRDYNMTGLPTPCAPKN